MKASQSQKGLFILLNIIVMVILHGNSRQFWPKIPYLSLRNESTSEHCRLIFNTLSIVSLIQLVLGWLQRERWLARLATIGAIPASLPLLLLFGHKVLGLKGKAAETYHLSLVPILPLAATVLEDSFLVLNAKKETEAAI